MLWADSSKTATWASISSIVCLPSRTRSASALSDAEARTASITERYFSTSLLVSISKTPSRPNNNPRPGSSFMPKVLLKPLIAFLYANAAFSFIETEMGALSSLTFIPTSSLPLKKRELRYSLTQGSREESQKGRLIERSKKRLLYPFISTETVTLSLDSFL